MGQNAISPSYVDCFRFSYSVTQFGKNNSKHIQNGYGGPTRRNHHEELGFNGKA